MHELGPPLTAWRAQCPEPRAQTRIAAGAPPGRGAPVPARPLEKGPLGVVRERLTPSFSSILRGDTALHVVWVVLVWWGSGPTGLAPPIYLAASRVCTRVLERQHQQVFSRMDVVRLGRSPVGATPDNKKKAKIDVGDDVAASAPGQPAG